MWIILEEVFHSSFERSVFCVVSIVALAIRQIYLKEEKDNYRAFRLSTLYFARTVLKLT